MSKDIIIQKSGVDQELDTVEKLRTVEVGGGTCDWVPEDERLLEPLTVTANGTYKVSDHAGLYGWSVVYTQVELDFVVIVGDNGNEYYVTKDAEGYIVRTPIPSSIQITTPPTVISYAPGDAINYSGMVVTLKTKDGETFTDETYTTGVIPAQELDLPVLYASASGPVPVRWQRVDGKRLEATVTITVTEASA